MTIGFDPGYIARQTDLIGSLQIYFFESFKYLATKREMQPKTKAAHFCAPL
jgi:hypothetical protein